MSEYVNYDGLKRYDELIKNVISEAANNGTYTVKTLVGSTTTNVSDFTANQSSADDVTFVQGSNVTITPDAANRKITIAAKDTTYGVVSTSSNGLAPKVTDTSKFLKGDGTWATPTDTNNRRSFYGTCDTDAATAAKVVTISDTGGWELKAGTIVGIKFTNTNTASNVTLNVNSSGAKSIWYNNAAYTGNSNAICGYASRVTYYMYDGTYWVWLNMGSLDGNTDKKVTQTVTTTSADYEVLFSKTADNTTRTEEARKNSNLKFNPSTGNLQTTQLNGVTIGSSPKFTDTTYSSKSAASGGTDVSLVTTGEKAIWNAKTSNIGTVTSVAVKMNGTTKGTVTTSGTIDLGTVITAHQDISGKANTADLAAVATSGSYNDLIDKPTSSSSSIFFGTCSSAADAQAKEVTISDQDFTLRTGVIIAVKFTNTNTYSVTAENPITLNVNNTGAKQIYYSHSNNNTGTNSTVYGSANGYTYYIYNEDDDIWLWMSHGADNNTTYSAGTAALLTAGTNTSARTWTAKILHDYISYPNVKYDVATQSKSGALTIDGSIPLHIITCTGNISSVALSTNPAAGHSCHVIFFATAARTVAIAHDATARVCPEAKALSLSIKANGYVEVDFLNANNKIYVRGV